nr:hypothetical protein [Proteus terrae subsp. cibarius]
MGLIAVGIVEYKCRIVHNWYCSNSLRHFVMKVLAVGR